MALKIVLVIAVCGMLFSGYLSYGELFAGGCSNLVVSCGKNAFSFASLPACVYGFFMYSVVFIVSVLGLTSKK